MPNFHRLPLLSFIAASLLFFSSPVSAELRLAQVTTPNGSLSDTSPDTAVTTPGNGTAADSPLGMTEQIEEPSEADQRAYDRAYDRSYERSADSRFDDFEQSPLEMSDTLRDSWSESAPDNLFDANDPDQLDYNDNDVAVNNQTDLLLFFCGLMALLGLIGFFYYQRRSKYPV